MRSIKKGATSQSVYIEVLDSTSTTGGRKTGLAFNTASLTAYYVRNQGSATAITLATLAAANSAWSSGGFKEVDATNMPGVYRLDVPDAAVAAGAGDDVTFTLKGATGMAQVSIGVQFIVFDLQTATQKVDLDTIKTQAVTCAAGVTVLASVGTAATSTAQTGDNFARLGAPVGASVSADVAAINAKTTNLPAAPASTTNITAGTITTATNLTNAPTAGDLTATMKTSVTTAATAATPIAASVTGAVGSVIGLTASDVGAIKLKTDLIPGTQDGKTFAQTLLLMAVTLLGKASGLGTATAVFRALDDSKDRVTTTVDASGNRTATTLDAS